MSSARLAELFRCLKLVRNTVDLTHEMAELVIQRAADMRTVVAELGPPSEPVAPILLQLSDDAETLAKALECIRMDLALVHITPRTENRGEGARGQQSKGRPMIKASLKPRRKGRA